MIVEARNWVVNYKEQLLRIIIVFEQVPCRSHIVAECENKFLAVAHYVFSIIPELNVAEGDGEIIWIENISCAKYAMNKICKHIGNNLSFWTPTLRFSFFYFSVEAFILGEKLHALQNNLVAFVAYFIFSLDA